MTDSTPRNIAPPPFISLLENVVREICQEWEQVKLRAGKWPGVPIPKLRNWYITRDVVVGRDWNSEVLDEHILGLSHSTGYEAPLSAFSVNNTHVIHYPARAGTPTA